MLVGRTLGPFEIDRELGSGAMGTVYRARVAKTGQVVAIKVLALGLGSNRTALARFEREAKVLKQLHHPNIVRLFTVGRIDKVPFYAMEYIQGESLDHVLQRRGRLAWEEVVTLGKQVCDALQHAHHAGIIHRDLKPSNLMLTPDGTVKLTDFGIAKDLEQAQLTSAHCTVGTAAYMSPEQCKGERHLTHRSDLYSLGVVLYELLTGRRPFEAETPMDMFMQHVHAPPPRPSQVVFDLPRGLDVLVEQLLAKDPEQRGFDATAVGQALLRVAEKVQQQHSAGLDAARARVVDRLAGQAPADDTDKQAARTLLASAAGKRRRRRRARPFYRRVGFQVPAILAVLAALVGVVYLVFRPESPDKLYQAAAPLMASANPDDRDKARDGPIALYLKHYAGRDDEQTRQVQAWADQIDLRNRERSLRKRLDLNIAPDDDAEATARSALHAEGAGDLDQARTHWQSLEPLRSSADRDQHALGLLAAQRLRELAEVEPRNRELHAQLEAWRRTSGTASPPDGPAVTAAERALAALRCEEFPDLALAHDRWLRLRLSSQRDAEQHVWFLLAAKKVKDLKSRLPKDPLQERIAAVQRRLREAEAVQTKQPRQAQQLCQEIVVLYGKNPPPELAQPVATAQALLQQLTDAGKQEPPPGKPRP